ncbi:hypothetical protein AMTR_s00008p00199080 [Amborella trichopoda]|uniref:Uncharacterized protein n=1 Tax=Amborella trichopoda TaxID=13333 RepID=W1NHV3_AMBTC|nr:hypothetical protein AMTR_s00008p00199080 [Amborella trichopoda]
MSHAYPENLFSYQRNGLTTKPTLLEAKGGFGLIQNHRFSRSGFVGVSVDHRVVDSWFWSLFQRIKLGNDTWQSGSKWGHVSGLHVGSELLAAMRDKIPTSNPT